MSNKKRIVVGMSGASGLPLGIEILKVLKNAPGVETHLVLTDTARRSIKYETQWSAEEICRLADAVYPPDELASAIASGSFRCDGMIVAPCSMETVAGIACGYSDNLLLRAADVTIKEHRPLVLLVRECPFSVIHLENMTKLARLGAWIVPMVMTFYNQPQTIEEMSRQLVGKALAPFDISVQGYYRWGEKE
jgi:4-hydroxy-3-polyprenylbenzoate decarboxylase